MPNRIPDDAAERYRHPAAAGQGGVEAGLEHRVPPRGRQAQQGEERELGGQRIHEEERGVEAGGDHGTEPHDHATVQAVEDRDGQGVADEPCARPDGQAQRRRAGSQSRLIDEVQGEERREHVTEQVRQLEEHRGRLHRALLGRGDEVAPAGRGASSSCGASAIGDAGDRGDAEDEEHGHERNREPPPSPEGHDGGVEQRARHDAHGSRQGPAGHERLATRRVGVDEDRLREPHEGARRGVVDDEGGEQHGVGRRAGHRDQRGREGHPAPEDEAATKAAVGEDAERDLDEVPDHGGDGEQRADLPVRQAEIGAELG